VGKERWREVGRPSLCLLWVPQGQLPAGFPLLLQATTCAGPARTTRQPTPAASIRNTRQTTGRAGGRVGQERRERGQQGDRATHADGRTVITQPLGTTSAPPPRHKPGVPRPRCAQPVPPAPSRAPPTAAVACRMEKCAPQLDLAPSLTDLLTNSAALSSFINCLQVRGLLAQRRGGCLLVPPLCSSSTASRPWGAGRAAAAGACAGRWCGAACIAPSNALTAVCRHCTRSCRLSSCCLSWACSWEGSSSSLSSSSKSSSRSGIRAHPPATTARRRPQPPMQMAWQLPGSCRLLEMRQRRAAAPPSLGLQARRLGRRRVDRRHTRRWGRAIGRMGRQWLCRCRPSCPRVLRAQRSHRPSCWRVLQAWRQQRHQRAARRTLMRVRVRSGTGGGAALCNEHAATPSCLLSTITLADTQPRRWLRQPARGLCVKRHACTSPGCRTHCAAVGTLTATSPAA